MYECKEARVLKWTSFHERYTYTVLRATWPLADRDLVSHSVLEQDPDTLAIFIRIDGQPAFVEPSRGRVRVPTMRGSWTFKPLARGGAVVTFQMYLEPGGSVPRGLVNTFADSTPFETLFKFREVAKEQR
jgi:hypothetical protein